MKKSLELFHHNFLPLFVLVSEQASLKVCFRIHCDCISVQQYLSEETVPEIIWNRLCCKSHRCLSDYQYS